MTTRVDALIRELAALFVKYRPSDWAPIIAELERGDRGRLAKSVAELAATPVLRAKPKRTMKAGGTRRTAPASSLTLRPERKDALEPLVDALMTKRILPSMSDVRSAFSALGLKGDPPKRRADGITAVISHLNSVAEERLPAAVEIVAREAAKAGRDDSYQRWFDLIGADGSSKTQ